MEQKINRQSKRRNKVHNEILSIAAKLIVEKGSQAVSLEEISNEADIARKTLYNHFDNKEAIIKEMVLPVCEHAMNYLEKTLLNYADIIYVTYLPLLEALVGQPDNEVRFKKAMTGLIRGLM